MPINAPPTRITFTADDFGLSTGVNEAVEIAHRTGVLNAASLMVSGPAAADAIRRAKTMPGLRVGLHLVLVEGRATLSPLLIPDLVATGGWMDARQIGRSFAYFCRSALRRQLAAEIEAQFAAFTATGLRLGHADAHKHMHLHPTVGRLMIAAGRRHGLTRLRVPAEPPATLRACGVRTGLAAEALYHWSRLLRAQARAAGLATDDHVFGLAWSGALTRDRLLALLTHLPQGSTEIYCHPATGTDPMLARTMPGYRHRAELDALCDPAVVAALALRGPAV